MFFVFQSRKKYLLNSWLHEFNLILMYSYHCVKHISLQKAKRLSQAILLYERASPQLPLHTYMRFLYLVNMCKMHVLIKVKLYVYTLLLWHTQLTLWLTSLFDVYACEWSATLYTGVLTGVSMSICHMPYRFVECKDPYKCRVCLAHVDETGAHFIQLNEAICVSYHAKGCNNVII